MLFLCLNSITNYGSGSIKLWVSSLLNIGKARAATYLYHHRALGRAWNWEKKSFAFPVWTWCLSKVLLPFCDSQTQFSHKSVCCCCPAWWLFLVRIGNPKLAGNLKGNGRILFSQCEFSSSSSWRRCRNWDGWPGGGWHFTSSNEPPWSLLVKTIWKHKCKYNQVHSETGSYSTCTLHCCFASFQNQFHNDYDNIIGVVSRACKLMVCGFNCQG